MRTHAPMLRTGTAGLVSLAAVAVATLTPSCSTDATMAETVDALMASFAGDSVPGAAVLVRQDGETVLARAYGMADLEAGVPVATDTDFRLASLTKAFTATAVLLLVRDGAFSLETTLSDAVPEFPAYGTTITLRHLLTHTSGVPDYEELVPDSQTRQLTDRDVLEILRRTDGTDFRPGSAYRYSNSGYSLLALAVERASGQRFADFLRDRVFVPLGMEGTVAFEEGVSMVPNRAFGHTVRDGQVLRTDQSTTSAVLGDGGVYSSIEDMAKWDGAYWQRLVLTDAEWSRATTPGTLADGSATTYGFGWIVDEYAGHRRQWHNGETRGFTNAIMRFPDDGLTIVILTNRGGVEPWGIAEQIADRYLDGRH